MPEILDRMYVCENVCMKEADISASVQKDPRSVYS